MATPRISDHRNKKTFLVDRKEREGKKTSSLVTWIEGREVLFFFYSAYNHI
jgi:hypothetical protein